MNPLIALIITATITSLLTTLFFVFKYGGYAAVTVPNWLVLVPVALLNIVVLLWFVNDFLTRDSVSSTLHTHDESVLEIPVKSTAYSPKLFRYHPFRLFSQKPIAQAEFVPVLSYRSAKGSIPVTETGLFISVFTRNFVERTAIQQITIVNKNISGVNLGEMMTIELENGGYYRVWLRLAEPETKIFKLEEALRDLGYPVHLIMGHAFPSIDMNPSDHVITSQNVSSSSRERLDAYMRAAYPDFSFHTFKVKETPSEDIYQADLFTESHHTFRLEDTNTTFHFIVPRSPSDTTILPTTSKDVRMTHAQAYKIAEAYIASREDGQELAIIDTHTEKRLFGWVFFYNSARFAKSQDIQDAIPGIGPLLVDTDGGTHQLPSVESPDQMIRQAEYAFIIALQRLNTETQNSDQYYIDEIAPIDQQADVWLIRFGIPDMDGAQVEIEVNTKTKEAINYRDSWS